MGIWVLNLAEKDKCYFYYNKCSQVNWDSLIKINKHASFQTLAVVWIIGLRYSNKLVR